MAYSFHGIATMSSALKAFQTQLDVTGSNISNAETKGYSRQTVSLSQAPGVTVTVGSTFQLGNGVNVAAVTRVRDMFLAGRRAETESKLGRADESLAGLSKIQEAMAEPGDNGISAAYDAFNNAWSALSASPSGASAKADVQQAGIKLVSKITGFANELSTQQAENAARTKDIVSDIDTKTAKIAELNTKIADATARGGVPNDLLDQRDATVLELSSLADVTVSKNTWGYDVSLNGYRMVDPSGVKALAGKYDAASGTIIEGSSTFQVNGGALAGAHDTAVNLTSTAARLDTFADTLRSEVNGLVSTGTTAAGVTGMPFFAEPVPPATSITASQLQLDAPIAANANNIPSGTSGLSGDGNLAQQISALRDKKVGALGNETMGSYYSGLVSDVGRQTSDAKTSADLQKSVASQIDAQISETTGVSMDDEMANLLRFQRAYQAAAKALSTFDSMSETIINMLNR